MKEEQKFPIFYLSATWEKKWVSRNKMYKEMPTALQLETDVKKMWEIYREKKGIDSSIVPTFQTKFVEYETWAREWFGHYTFDLGQTNLEALESFRNFVRRKKQLNDESLTLVYCLMGAEDEWRWRGSGETGTPEDESPPPCRCKHCRESGLIRINH